MRDVDDAMKQSGENKKKHSLAHHQALNRDPKGQTL